MLIKRISVDGNRIVCDQHVNTIFSQHTRGQSFGHDIMYNAKNESIIVIIGASWQKSVYHSPSETHRDS